MKDEKYVEDKRDDEQKPPGASEQPAPARMRIRIRTGLKAGGPPGPPGPPGAPGAPY